MGREALPYVAQQRAKICMSLALVQRTAGKIARETGFAMVYPLVICYIAMEHGPFIDGLPIKNGDFPWLC